MRPWLPFAVIAALLGAALAGLQCYTDDIRDQAILEHRVDSLRSANTDLMRRDSVRRITIDQLEDSIRVIGRVVEERQTVSARHRATARVQAVDLGKLVADSVRPKLDSVRVAYESALAAQDSTIRLQSLIIAQQQRIMTAQDSSLAELRIQLARSLDLNSQAIKTRNRGFGRSIVHTALAIGIGVAVGAALK